LTSIEYITSLVDVHQHRKCKAAACKPETEIPQAVGHIDLRWVVTLFQFFRTKRYGNVPMELPPPNTGLEYRWGRQTKIVILGQYLHGYWIHDCWSASSNCDGPPCSLPHRRRRECCLSQPAEQQLCILRQRNQRVTSLQHGRPRRNKLVYCYVAAIRLDFKQEVKVILQKAPHVGPIPRLGVTPGGRKLYH